MADPIHTLTVRRDALKSALDMLNDKFDYADNEPHLTVGSVAERLDAEIAGLDFALTEVGKQRASEAALLRDALSHLLAFEYDALGAWEMKGFALGLGVIQADDEQPDLSAIPDDRLAQAVRSMAAFIWPDKLTPITQEAAAPLAGETAAPANEELPGSQPPSAPEDTLDPRPQPTVNVTPEETACLLRGELPVQNEAVSSPAQTGDPEPIPAEAIAPSLAVSAPEPPPAPGRAAMPEAKQPTQKERCLELYLEGTKEVADIVAVTGFNKGSVQACLSLLRKEGAIPDERKQAILAAYEAGHRTPEAIQAETGLPLPSIKTNLSVLHANGVIAPESKLASGEAQGDDHRLPPSPATESQPEDQSDDEDGEPAEPFIPPQERILAAWEAGKRSDAEIAEHTGMSAEVVNFNLGLLRMAKKLPPDNGRVAAPERGKHPVHRDWMGCA